MLVQRIMKRPSQSWLRVSAALLIAVGCSLNPRPEDPGLDDQSGNIPDLGAPSHSRADASVTSPPGTGGSNSQGGFGGGFTSAGGSATGGPITGTDGAAEPRDASPADMADAARDGGADASDAADSTAGDGG